VEDSDEDSVNGNQGGSKQAASAANRNGVRSKNVYSGEKLDPIPLPLNSEESGGVLSGKRYDSRSSFPLKKDKDSKAAPKDSELTGVNAYSGFSAIYPAITSAASEERYSKKDLQSRVSNPSGANAIGRMQRRNNSQDQLDLMSDEVHLNEGNSNFSEAVLNDNALQLNIRPKLVVQQAKQNAALIRMKSHGLVVPSVNGASNVNISNAENAEVNSLNVCGNGFGDRQGMNGDVAIRPINKNRNNSRKVLLSKQPAPIDLGGLSIDGVGSSANPIADEPPFNARQRVFSKGDLSKQPQLVADQQQQLSARDRP